jgi:UDP-N-acetylglucosamine 4-epimerase
MGDAYARAEALLTSEPRVWLVTGAAGFIGSNLVEHLLNLRQTVHGLDNFASGHQRNLDEVRAAVGPENWGRFRFVDGDIRDLDICREAVSDCAHVLHNAALGSVPVSLEDPLTTHRVNVEGYLNILIAARDAGVRRLVYAASSASYGDDATVPQVENRIGRPLSPYAASKTINEIYAEAFSQSYGFRSVGLRYFNVFGPRQDAAGAYAAVIPAWTGALLRGEQIWINGDGETTRDFCYVGDAVQANILAAMAPDDAAGEVYNVATGTCTTLNQLLAMIAAELTAQGADVDGTPQYRDFRAGDIRHSQADIAKAAERLGYKPAFDIRTGLAAAMPWYCRTPASAP